jgi:hypothetical protein
MRTNDGKLIVPVSAIAADAVEENRQRTGSYVIHGDPWNRGDDVSRPCRHRSVTSSERQLRTRRQKLRFHGIASFAEQSQAPTLDE